jgi:hypothetical protein
MVCFTSVDFKGNLQKKQQFCSFYLPAAGPYPKEESFCHRRKLSSFAILDKIIS